MSTKWQDSAASPPHIEIGRRRNWREVSVDDIDMPKPKVMRHVRRAVCAFESLLQGRHPASALISDTAVVGGVVSGLSLFQRITHPEGASSSRRRGARDATWRPDPHAQLLALLWPA